MACDDTPQPCQGEIPGDAGPTFAGVLASARRLSGLGAYAERPAAIPEPAVAAARVMFRARWSCTLQANGQGAVMKGRGLPMSDQSVVTRKTARYGWVPDLPDARDH